MSQNIIRDPELRPGWLVSCLDMGNINSLRFIRIVEFFINKNFGFYLIEISFDFGKTSLNCVYKLTISHFLHS